METDRICLRAPIPEIQLAADYLDQAISAHLSGDERRAAALIRAANITEVCEWAESLWGKKSPHVQRRVIDGAPPLLIPADRVPVRMPVSSARRELHLRDGFHCRFCGIPVIRKEIRDRLRKLYPDSLTWPREDAGKHAAFKALWAQYDHVLPHARGGTNDLQNVIVTCAPCNYARMNYTLEEVGLADPRLRQPKRSTWDGLERLLTAKGLSTR